MSKRSSGHLVEHKVTRWEDSVLRAILRAGDPNRVLTYAELLAIAQDQGAGKRLLTQMFNRKLFSQVTEESYRLSNTGRVLSEMLVRRTDKRVRKEKGEPDVVVMFTAPGSDMCEFLPRTRFGIVLVKAQPLFKAAGTGKLVVAQDLVADIARHMRNDGGIVENRVRLGWSGSAPRFILEDLAA